MSTAWETLWSIVGQSLPESGFPQVVLSFMQLIEENDAAAVYQCVSGYGAATAGEAVDAARILYTYINQLNPPLLPPSVVDTLCSASIPWNELMNVLHHIPSSHYAALHALLKHSYSVCAMYNLSPDLLAGYYSRALFKMRAEELRPLLSVLITNFTVLNEPHVSAVDNMIRPTLSEVVQSFLNVSSSPWHPPPAHELQTQSARLQKAFGPFTNSQLGEYTDAASNRGQNVAKPRPSTKSSDSSHLDQEAHEKNLELLRSLSLLQLSSTALTEKQLRSAKSELKHKIHAWEDAFRKRTHRAPTVHDKQPVREAYDTYKQLKLRLEATFAEKHYTGSTAAATATAVNPTTVSSASPNTQQQAAGTSNSGTSSTITNQNTNNTNGAGSYSQGTSIVASTAPALSRAHPAPHNSLTGNRHHNPGSASIGNSGTMPTAYSSSSNSTHSITQSSPAAGGALQQPASQGKSQNNESPPPQLSVSGTVPKPNVVSTRNTTNYGQISTGAAGVANKAANLEPATLAELKEEKHNLKKTLHEFEASIRAQYGRAPTKDDRRLMYSQYARYGELKAILQPTNN